MKKILVFEAVIIIALVVLIIKIPAHGSLKELKADSLMQEHAGHKTGDDQSGVQGDQTVVPSTGADQGQNSGATESMMVALSRPKGGYSAYKNGTFVEPGPLPNEGNDGGAGTVDDGDGADTDSGDNSSDGNGGDGSSDSEWEIKDIDDVTDTGKRGVTTGSINMRRTPTTQSDDNLITTLDEGVEVIVTDENVKGIDPNVAKWVEVVYDGKVGYVSAKFVEIK